MLFIWKKIDVKKNEGGGRQHLKKKGKKRGGGNIGSRPHVPVNAICKCND